MREFIAEYCHKNDEKINDDMFTRKYDRPLVEYILDTCKNLEVIPAITLESYEFITDQTRIRTQIDKRLSKDPKIKNNKALERIAQQNETLYDLLVLNFRVRAKGRDELVQRKLRILKQLKGGYYLRGGKKVLILNQVVDNSTYVKGNILNFKTTLYPIKLSTVQTKLKFLEGEVIHAPSFRLDLFMKVTNPLYYFLAEYGLASTIEMFQLDGIMTVVDDIINTDDYMYLPINDHLYLEIHEKAFYAHEFIPVFVASLYDAIKADKNEKLSLSMVYNNKYWLERLSEVFAKKRSADKGERVLISFEKIMDPYSKKRLALKKFHRKNTFTILRWEMTNYSELLKKDSNDLQFKRIRANETLAYFFDNYISRNVYSLLNTDNPPFDKYIRLLNSISENTLIKATQGSGKSSPTSMLRYERYNDFDAIELSRYTLKGPTGLNGGKKKTSLQYRDIYPSHLGRFDIDVCSSADPGLTGYLTANVKLSDKGYFETDNAEPDNYDPVIDAIVEGIQKDKNYHSSRVAYVRRQLSRDEDGFIVLRKKLTTKVIDDILQKEPEAHGLYRTNDGLRLIHSCGAHDNKGFIVLVHKRQTKTEVLDRADLDGFIHLHPVTMKLDQYKKNE